MRKVAAVLLGLLLALPTACWFLGTLAVGYAWVGVKRLWPQAADAPTEADLPEEPEWPQCRRIRVFMPLWYDEPENWQEHKH